VKSFFNVKFNDIKNFFYQKTNLGEKTIWALGWPDMMGLTDQ
jgi:hypothetical protein